MSLADLTRSHSPCDSSYAMLPHDEGTLAHQMHSQWMRDLFQTYDDHRLNSMFMPLTCYVIAQSASYTSNV